LIPKIKWLVEKRPFSINDHFNEDHESPIDGIQQVYIHCPGCNQTVFLLKAAMDPDTTFALIPTVESSDPGAPKAMIIIYPYPHLFTFFAVSIPPARPEEPSPMDLSKESTAPEIEIAPSEHPKSKKHRSKGERLQRAQKISLHRNKKSFNEAVAQLPCNYLFLHTFFS